MLASFARIKYPRLFFASASSSAPVQAKLDMTEYNDLVADAYALPSVGGSPACKAAIARGHAEVGRRFSSASGRASLVALFSELRGRQPSWLESEANQLRFSGGGVAPFPAQSNDPACLSYGCSIGRVCDVVTSGENRSSLERLAGLANGFYSAAEEEEAAPEAAGEAAQGGEARAQRRRAAEATRSSRRRRRRRR
mmetsp:Transcript_9868/g.29169  ORF Transcript_9868/g.29169 Transcript_9868/m.29169 type:complete len:196 (-) Transcript_9868:84-671(-)